MGQSRSATAAPLALSPRRNSNAGAAAGLTASIVSPGIIQEGLVAGSAGRPTQPFCRDGARRSRHLRLRSGARARGPAQSDAFLLRASGPLVGFSPSPLTVV